MIELPEAITIAGQMNEALTGRRIASGTQGNSPHKFAFYTRSAEEYERILAGRTVGQAVARGSSIVVSLEPEYLLVLGEGGERILLHDSEATLPKKRQLLLRFEDGSALTVSVSGWGAAQLFTWPELEAHPYAGRVGVSPLEAAFTFDYFDGLFGTLGPDDPASVKAFVISKPGVYGVGNGYLQDVLFRARIHPRRPARLVDADERRVLYDAIRETVSAAVALGGRDSERDLYNQPGCYHRILDSTAVGQPCSVCGAAIEKIQFLGGSAYFCPCCQT